MISVASLLNPSPLAAEDIPGTTFKSPRTPPPCTLTPESSASPFKRLKMSKPKTTPVKAKAKGKVNYQPYEQQDEITMREHKKFKVEPIGAISEYPKHIPYKSDKKTFEQKTGRNAIEAYMYTFQMPDDDRDREPHSIMWDYNVGLVRITALFKSLNHSKTMPSKVMSSNPGLREISHSITGGSIGAQGYWVPFEAAKAVAATFCYKIRYVLTPVFGKDFPAMCTEPGDPAFLRTTIDPDIIARCQRQADAVRRESRAPSTAASSPAPSTMKSGAPWTPKSLGPPSTDTESGYGTDNERSPFGSPNASTAHPWSPVNIPRSSAAWGQYAFPSNSKAPQESRKQQDLAKRILLKGQGTRHGQNSSDDSGPEVAPTQKRRRFSRHESKRLNKETLAAKALMQLRKADTALAQNCRSVDRRAST